jgi:mRNA-degrading endonuclease RelE of RelBE toxin-antitoxin system
MNHNPKKWEFDKPKDFKEQVLALPKEIRPKLTEVMDLLSKSDNPLALGKKKKTKLGEIYAIRLSDYYRLSYDILDPKTRKINIFRVGDHKFVQGKG